MATEQASAVAGTAPASHSQDRQLHLISERFHRYADDALKHSRADTATGPALLKRLADDLNPANGRAPAALDLVTAYPADALLPDRPPSRSLERLLTGARLFRDVLVFVPILVTWWKLHDALEAYGRAGSQASFLLGWQAGSFNDDHIRRGVQDFDPLSQTAWWVVIALLVVIAFAGLVNVLESRLDSPRHEAERQQITQDLALASHLLASPAEDGTPSHRDLRALVQQLETSIGSLIGRLASTADDVRAALESSSGKKIEEAIQTWIDKSAVLAEALAAMRAPAETLEAFRKLQDDIAAGQRELRAELAAMVAQVERATLATTDHADTTRHYQDAGTALISDSVTRLAGGTDRLANALEQLEYLVADTREFVDYVRRLDGGALR